jgi:hypothetical protein
MRRRRDGILVRICGMTLLLLALLPVTAPFSTFDLIDFFRDTPADAGSFVQTKTPGSKLASLPGAVVHVQISRLHEAGARAFAAAPARSERPTDIPLRL